ncbi:unnamed protein product [Paramecium octaurelia]|uniref:Uncharacterized protein n=1 Tax=Paramecium octaurelia TaxID=43137 RepID=A0A8S1V772_PAROT|nr:unnamed protein product [Paramecium octaurelia]
MHRQQYCTIFDHSQLPIFGVCLDQKCNSQRPYCHKCMQSIHINHVTSLISFEEFSEWIRNRQNQIQELKKFITLSQLTTEQLKFINHIQEMEINQEKMQQLELSQLNIIAYNLTKIDHLLGFKDWQQTNKNLLEINKICQTMKQIAYMVSNKDQVQNLKKQNFEQNKLGQDQQQVINDKSPLINNPRVQIEKINQQQEVPNQKIKWQEKSKEFELLIWSDPRFIRTKLQINQTKNTEVQYIKDGFILRSDLITTTDQKILKNIEQIKNLEWRGNFGNNNLKVGKWVVTWLGKTLEGVGGLYTVDGQKHGRWRELSQNYWTLAQVYEEGEYNNGLRIGVWKYFYQDKQINGGLYNNQGQKNGEWQELSTEFWDKSQIIYHGVYKNGNKVGRWVTKYEGSEIGGGLYEDYQEQDNFVLVQNNLFKEYDFQSIVLKQLDDDQSQNSIIDNSTDSLDHKYEVVDNLICPNKVGKWIELSNGFYKNSQVTYEGEYRNGKKFGRWEILWKNSFEDKNKVQIGGGSYDQESQLKTGKWVELSEGFWENSQVIYKGEYKNGKKQNSWTIESLGEQIGGGSYDKEGQIKIGSWIEPINGYFGGAQVIEKGQYLNDKKVGKWDICYREQENQSFITIGGGSYDQNSSVKTGNWIELNEGFWDRSQVTFNGEYRNGKKVGRWNSYLKKNYGDYQNVQIGGGSYSEQDSLKIGEWIDLKDQFIVFQQLVYKGEYKDGKKIGTWMEIEIRKNETRGILNYEN